MSPTMLTSIAPLCEAIFTHTSESVIVVRDTVRVGSARPASVTFINTTTRVDAGTATSGISAEEAKRVQNMAFSFTSASLSGDSTRH